MTTTNYAWSLPIVGGNQNQWGTMLNNILTDIDAKMFARTGGTISGNVSVAGSVTATVNGSDAISNQVYGQNVAGTRAFNWQLTAAGNPALWAYNGSSWAKVFEGSSDGLAVTSDSVDGNQLKITGATNQNYQIRVGFDTTNLLGKIQAIHVGAAYKDLALQPYGGNLGIGRAANANYRAIIRGIGTTSATKTLVLENSSGTETVIVDDAGNLLVGTTSGSNHCIWKNVSDGTLMLDIAKTAGVPTARFYTCSAAGDPSASGANLLVWRNATTSRSINAAGTINASGADYAEYERNNGTKFAKGQVVGFKEDGTLTDVYADAIRFGVKSTNPGLVGGDAWGTDKQVGKRPDEPQFSAAEYKGPQDPGPAPTEPAQQTLADNASAEDKSKASDDFAAAHAAWATASTDHEKLAYEYRAAQPAHAARVEIAKNLFDTATYPEYQRALTAFEARLEAERQTVDRIAYCGKVPVAVYDATPGGYIIADKDSKGKIVGKFVADPDFAQYKKAVGRVNRIMDAEASAHLVEAINGADPTQFVGMAEIAVMTH